MSLAFLQVDPDAGNAVSPIAPATLGDPEVQRRALSQSVAVADVSLLRKTELQGPLSHTLGEARRENGGWWCPITPTRAIVLGDPPEVPDGVVDLDVTAGYGAIVIAGPLARETFARFCALDLREAKLPVAGFRPGSVARTPGFVLRESDQRFLALFGAAYSSYVWDVVIDTATRLGGCAVSKEVVADA